MRAQSARFAAWTCAHCGNDVPASYAHKCLPFDRAIEDADHVIHELEWYGNNWPEKRLLAQTCRAAAALLSSLISASCDTHPEDGDSTQIEAPLVSGAVPKADAQ